ncbi:mkpa protein [Anaeramoeba flamelloides]|uniref:Mkpa protein n=1 Tax=Anaeramoeba flamelloides TaxID=1746091 RepID=A0ABQ8YR78_9EUKA|nr:mkpa protein [Anaeramoeba flamelloides]
MTSTEKKEFDDTICYKVIPQLFIGSMDAAENYENLKENKITHILNAAGSFVQPLFTNEFTYKVFDIHDSLSEDILKYISKSNFYIDQVIEQGGSILVHCVAGISRSAAIVIAYLMHKKGLNYDDAYKLVKEKREIISPNLSFQQSLMIWGFRNSLKND